MTPFNSITCRVVLASHLMVWAAGGSFVLCVSSSGHRALEAVSQICCPSDPFSADVASWTRSDAEDTCAESCSDTLFTSPIWPPQDSGQRPAVLVHLPVPGLAPACMPSTHPTWLPVGSPLHLQASLSALDNIVLLV